MHINLLFWLLISISFIGTSLYYFGEVSSGYYSEMIKFTGGFITFGILIISFFVLGWRTAILLIVVEFTIISFVSAYLIESITKKYIK